MIPAKTFRPPGLPIALLVVCVLLTMPSCRGKHAPPPGFVGPEITGGHASLVVRIEDGAWVHLSSIAGIEAFHPAPRHAAILLNLSLARSCGDEPGPSFGGCGLVNEKDFDMSRLAGQCEALKDFPPGSFDRACEFLEEQGFELAEKKEGETDAPFCDGSGKGLVARIDAVRLSRVFQALFSGKKALLDENADDRIVNYIYNFFAPAGAEQQKLCGMSFENGPGEKWFSGWSPCRQPGYVVIVYGDEPQKLAEKIVEILKI